MLLNSAFLKLNRTSILLVLLSILFYFSFAYDLNRTDYFKANNALLRIVFYVL